ncbi:LytTR family transcriptional regulator [Fulvivirga sp. M361]|uniref:LytR/AlgR family response regulator transcription factor n=1 Tax=Fulvivirga sp. M361 TaxID=2594266 RepID=UPI00117A26BD|nr:LytTR family transcriptional regulator [Fulvivirga sp. M361]
MFTLIKSDRRTYKVSLNEIVYFKSSGDYLHVIRKDKSLITKESIKNVLLSLPEDRFVQIHRSYVININYLKYMESNCISIDKVVLPIGDKYRQQLRQIMK